MFEADGCKYNSVMVMLILLSLFILPQVEKVEFNCLRIINMMQGLLCTETMIEMTGLFIILLFTFEPSAFFLLFK